MLHPLYMNWRVYQHSAHVTRSAYTDSKFTEYVAGGRAGNGLRGYEYESTSIRILFDFDSTMITLSFVLFQFSSPKKIRFSRKAAQIFFQLAAAKVSV